MTIPVVTGVLFQADDILLYSLIVALVMKFDPISIIGNALRLRAVKI